MSTYFENIRSQRLKAVRAAEFNLLAQNQEWLKLRIEQSKGAMVQITSDVGLTGAAENTVTWASAIYDAHGSIFSGGAPTRLTVPTGWTKVKLWLQSGVTAYLTDTFTATIRKNGDSTTDAGESYNNSNTAGPNYGFLRSNLVIPVQIVDPGDYFQAILTPGSAATLRTASTYFAMELIE